MSSVCKVGLLGHRIDYSKSPEIFESIFNRVGIEGNFDCFDIPPNQFKHMFWRLVSSGMSGLSVTIPYKVTVMDYLTSIDKASGIVGAVNSIKLEDDKSYGYNTDTYGFSLGLEAHRELVTGRATILGCGGAAAAVVCSLYSDFGVRQFQVYGRDEYRLDSFVDQMKMGLASCRFRTTVFASMEAVPKSSNIIVNCTPLGGGSFPKENPLPQTLNWKETQVYYDLNYNSASPALAEALSRGVIAIDGRKMLVGQAVQSFKIWTGMEVDFEPVFEDVFGRE